ncbi:PRC-barrel domain-containing protein [Brachybacterium sp. AOP42-B2-9]|uniref:PRC-barrel domain-containing protein n=1 Tax=Brachybacterium sp. AOP42-B2-9 TaxID=3457672 RepID=UPI004033869A
MSPDSTPGDTTPGGASAADRSTEERAERPAGRDLPASELSARAERRHWLQSLAGVTVRGSDGRPVGRVRDVYLHDATGELAAITVMPRQLSARSVLIPASAIAALPEPREDPAAPSPGAGDDASGQGPDQVLHLLVDTATAKAGARPPHTLHATPEGLREAAAALRLGEGSARA